MAQAEAFYADGSPVAAEDFAEAVQSGQAHFRRGTEVRMRDQAGREIAVPAEEVGQAQSGGLQLLTHDQARQNDLQREHGDLGGMALTAAEGAASGLTFGLSDLVLEDMGADTAERAAANQGTRLVSELGGAIAPTLLSGGAGGAGVLGRAGGALRTAGAAPRAVAGLGRAAEGLTYSALGGGGKTALGRAAARGLSLGVGGAVEGALYGGGEAVRASALRDEELTVEGILSAMGEGALYGGAFGGALGFGGSLAASGAKKGAERLLGSRSLREAAEDYANQRAFKAVTGNYAKPFKVATRGGRDLDGTARLGKRLRDDKINISDLDEAVEQITRRKKEAGEAIGSIVRRVDDANVKPAVDDVLAPVRKQIAELRSNPTKQANDIAERLESKVRFFEEHGGEKKFSDFWELRKEFDAAAKFDKLSGPTPETLAFERARGELEGQVMGMLETASQSSDDAAGVLREWTEQKARYADYVKLDDAARNLQLNRAKNRSVSLTDYLTGLGGTGAMVGTLGAVPGAVAGLAMTAAHKIAREQGSAWVSKMADRIATMDGKLDDAAKRIAHVVSDTGKRAIAPTAAKLGSVRDRYEEARAQTLQLTTNPGAAQGLLADATTDAAFAAPHLAPRLVAQIMGDAQYLESTLPPTLTRASASATPLADSTRVPESEMRKFARRAAALADPMTVVDELAAGKINRDAIDAIKVRRPRLFEALQAQVMQYTMQRGEELPYRNRVLISLAFDFPADRSLTPEAIATIQAVNTQPQQEGPGRPPGSPSRLDSDLPKAGLTPSQKAIGA